MATRCRSSCPSRCLAPVGRPDRHPGEALGPSGMQKDHPGEDGRQRFFTACRTAAANSEGFLVLPLQPRQAWAAMMRWILEVSMEIDEEDRSTSVTPPSTFC
ncbi:unnamed protein product [Durusdinium trenchii]|uniref:Uncharacterized protein n=1 Tax=Durusdinium trenchii TaxID=1381693 RepID=A0ABP0IXM9_9DINO